MDRNEKKNYTTERRYGMKSKISETIHARFSSSHMQHVSSAKSKTNFEMDWETFRQLNWKQIMGILMVKDKNCLRIKHLLKCK
jgi:phosphotransferase system HPr-like phosphotransfer protein